MTNCTCGAIELCECSDPEFSLHTTSPSLEDYYSVKPGKVFESPNRLDSGKTYFLKLCNQKCVNLNTWHAVDSHCFAATQVRVVGEFS